MKTIVISRLVKEVFLILLFLALLSSNVFSVVSCGTACLTSAQVAQETSSYQSAAAGSKCLFIYDDKIYEPPIGTIGSGMHQGVHACGADVTGIMRDTHLNNPQKYLIPYVCAPLCVATQCPDADGDGFTSSACGGADCNDNNAQIKQGAAEICNNIDDNCNSQLDENLLQQKTCGIGQCQNTITQLCIAGAYAPECTAKPPINEICGNYVDDDCNGRVDDNCDETNIPNPPSIQEPSQINSSQGSTNLSPIVAACKPKCSELCGGDNGCGGKCPNDNKYVPGKCGNPACVPDCGALLCGQSDGCNGICSKGDLRTCGLCGNPPCCAPEVCDDGIDNDCDNQTDEGCEILSAVYNTLSGQRQISQSELISLKNPVRYISVMIARPSFLARIAGIVAFFFAGLTLLVGIYRFQLIEKFSRKEVIRYHALLGIFSCFLIFMHILFVLRDKGGWAGTVKLEHIFIPYISTPLLINISLGVVGMYLFILTIISGIFFIRISKKWGYNTWLLLHRGSYIFYLFILFHAIRIGTDFENPYILLFFSHVILLVLGHIIFKTIKMRQMNKTSVEHEDAPSLQELTVGDIINKPELVGTKIITSGDIVKVTLSSDNAGTMWRIYDQFESIFATLPPGIQRDNYSKIIGTLKKEDDHLFLEVQEVKK